MKNKIKIEYNLNKDAYNYARLVVFFNSYGSRKTLDDIPEKLQKKIKDLYKKHLLPHSELIRASSHETFEPIIDYLKKSFGTKKLEQISKNIEIPWVKIEEKYFQQLSTLLQKPIYQADYTCYLTTLHSCPFFVEENWFMTSAFSRLEVQLYVICHEFMHLQFLYYYKEYCLEKGLTKSEIGHFKEAITFLLNEPEFEPIIKFRDKGYPQHQELREKLKELWDRDKNFKNFLDEIIAKKEHYFQFLKE